MMPANDSSIEAARLRGLTHVDRAGECPGEGRKDTEHRRKFSRSALCRRVLFVPPRLDYGTGAARMSKGALMPMGGLPGSAAVSV
jgi:hypothetical protein